jgi:hypothetical protein
VARTYWVGEGDNVKARERRKMYGNRKGEGGRGTGGLEEGRGEREVNIKNINGHIN